MLRRLFSICLFGIILFVSICGCTESSPSAAANAAQSASASESGYTEASSKINSNSSTTSTSSNTASISSGTASVPSSDRISTGKKNALKSAGQYLNYMAFSYSGLIEQLEFEGYSNEEAVYAAENCGADWNEQAVLSAMQYLKTMAFSKDGLVEQLEYEGYTHEQATYGAEQAYSATSDTAASTISSSSGSATVGEQNALQSAKQYLNVMAFSYTGLIDQLTYEGYSDSEAKYAADNCGANWEEQAVKAAKQYLDIMSFSRQSLIEQLEFEGYTYDQASYAATQNGY